MALASSSPKGAEPNSLVTPLVALVYLQAGPIRSACVTTFPDLGVLKLT
jgi:hypothetical protein